MFSERGNHARKRIEISEVWFSIACFEFCISFGDGVYRFGLNWFLVSSYGNAQVLGWLTGFGFLVYLLNDVYVGSVLDRFNRKWVLLGADLFGAIGTLTLSMVINPAHPQLWLLFALTFILNVDVSFAYPAARAILRMSLRRVLWHALTPGHLQPFQLDKLLVAGWWATITLEVD